MKLSLNEWIGRDQRIKASMGVPLVAPGAQLARRNAFSRRIPSLKFGICLLAERARLV